MELQGKVALVTGAGSGIGKAIALAMAEEGAAVVVNDIVEEKAGQVVEEILAGGWRAASCVADAGTMEGADRSVGLAVDTFGRLDILVNNAGVAHRQAWFWELTEQEFDSVIVANLKSAFVCSKAAARVMIPQKAGRIINVSSNAGRYGNALLSIYSASKAGMIGLTKSCARELGPHNILVNALTPAAASPMLGGLSEDSVRRFVDSLALGRLGRPEEVAAMVVFLASDKASYSTGQVFDVAGGRYM